MEQYTTQFLRKEEAADSTFKYLFAKPEKFTFNAGQYIVLEIVNPRFSDDRPSFRSLSMASAPHEDHLAFIMRSSESGFKKSINALEEGDEIIMKGPLGDMRLPEDLDIPVVFLTAGVGITPARSMLLDAQHRESPRDMTLIYSNREVPSAACFSEMSDISLPHYRCIHTISDSTEGWDGELLRVDKDFLQKNILDLHTPIFYIVGTSGYINAMKANLIDLGVSKEKMMIDNFG